MELLKLDIVKEKQQLVHELKDWFTRTKDHLNFIPEDLTSQINLLNTIRKDIYEDLNQLQHKALIIRAAEMLQIEFPSIDNWTWFPKQTSHPNYADLTGYVNQAIFLNAEATTSNKPQGLIDKRMFKTLIELNQKEGLKFYFVQSDAMLNRAVSKIANNNFSIVAKKV